MEHRAIPSSINQISDRCAMSFHRPNCYVIADVNDLALTYPTMSFVKASFDHRPEDKNKHKLHFLVVTYVI